MNTTAMLWSVLVLVWLSLSLGLAVKLWMYKVRDLFLVLTPILVFILTIVVPLVLVNVLVFHPRLVESAIKDQTRSLSTRSAIWRMWFGLRISAGMIAEMPVIMGILAMGIGDIYTRRAPVPSAATTFFEQAFRMVPTH